ncbi:hypothetical protein yc1106_02846 [Curvularia clavata]|uniref:Uncharacterized protein n=1 Tax=Curvularia clavata TaxID=95742 RepID=A0A9Q8Z4J1_CURCL|nr:hypothetical protein yc1106_02846 [Curvularia clavata]
MEDNMLPSTARTDATDSMPEGTVDRLKVESPEPASAGAESSYEASGNTELEASDDRSAGHVPNDIQLQLVLRNAHPLQDTSLSLDERVGAFNMLEREGQERKAQADIQDCQECGQKHPPPHLSKEQNVTLRSAYKEGKRLRKQFQYLASRPSQSDATMAHAGPSAAPSASLSKKGKSVFCTRCAKWHPGGSQACRTPLCVAGCGLNHPPFEDCGEAANRFARVGARRNPPTPAPSGATATDSSRMAALSTLLRGLPDDANSWGAISALANSIAREKRSEAEAAEDAGSSKRQKKKTGRGNSCQTQSQHPHQKGPPKPDDKGKGKGRATEPEIKPEPAWE